jgi:hypothetical protein
MYLKSITCVQTFIFMLKAGRISQFCFKNNYCLHFFIQIFSTPACQKPSEKIHFFIRKNTFSSELIHFNFESNFR